MYCEIKYRIVSYRGYWMCHISKECNVFLFSNAQLDWSTHTDTDKWIHRQKKITWNMKFKSKWAQNHYHIGSAQFPKWYDANATFWMKGTLYRIFLWIMTWCLAYRRSSSLVCGQRATIHCFNWLGFLFFVYFEIFQFHLIRHVS